MRRTVSVIAAFIAGTTFASFLAIAWTEPTADAPGDNVAAPVNTGPLEQLKSGVLGVDGLAVFGNTVLAGPDSYMNFGATSGTTGYGIRDNAGTLEFKNSGGVWASLTTAIQTVLAIGAVEEIKFADGTTQTTAATTSGSGAGGLVLIATKTASNSPTIDFAHGTDGVVLDDTYDFYEIRFTSVQPQTDDVELWMRVATLGPSWKSGTTDYSWQNVGTGDDDWNGLDTASSISLAGLDTGGSDASDTHLGNAASENATGVLEFGNPEVSEKHQFIARISFGNINGNSASVYGGGQYRTASPIVGIRFLMSSGNITSGTFRLYGYAK